jgi:hypothetical protein
MIATMRLRKSVVTVALVGSVLTLTGCAYRLYGPIPASQELVQIVAKTPDQYTVQVDTGSSNRRYEVPRDGRVKIAVPSYRFPCGVYLFNAVKIGGYSDPLEGWSVSITRDGRTIRRLSVRNVVRLSINQDGYHILKLKE